MEAIIEKSLKNLTITKEFKIPCADKNNYAFLLENLTSKYI